MLNEIKTSTSFAPIRECGVILNAIGSALFATPFIVGAGVSALNLIVSDINRKNISDVGAPCLLCTFVISSVVFTKYLRRMHKISKVMEQAGLREKDYKEKRDLLPSYVGSSPPALIVAIYSMDSSSKINLIENILDAGANVNEKDIYGHTALAIAARIHNVQAVRFLLQKGASVKSLQIEQCLPNVQREIFASIIRQHFLLPLQYQEKKESHSHQADIARLIVSYLA